MLPNAMRYEIELDMLERNSALSDPQAIALLHSEFALALNAAYFIALAEDIDVTILSRTFSQDGVARYRLALELVERGEPIDDAVAATLLRSEFQRALNASHFWRVCVEDFVVELVARAPAYAPLRLRAA